MCGFNTLSDGSPLNLEGVALQGSSATQVIQRETRRSRPTTATVNAIGEKVIVRGECAGVRASIFIDTGSGVSLITTEFVIRNGLYILNLCLGTGGPLRTSLSSQSPERYIVPICVTLIGSVPKNIFCPILS